MATEIIMPQMGMDMKEGTVVRWIKAEGETVSKGEPLAEIETDKAVVEVEAYASGVLRKVIVKAGAKVPVGQIIGIIAGPQEQIPEVAARSLTAPASAQPKAAEGAKAPAPTEDGERAKASPLARKEAEERGIDLSQVPGTGPGGRITKEDVLQFAVQWAAPAAAAPTPTAPAAEVLPLSRMRQAIARSMSRSKREIPHFYVTVDVDMTAAIKLREDLNRALEGDVRVSINDMIMKACAKALSRHPMFNASYTEEGVRTHKAIHIGMAIALEEGLIAPAILDCGNKGLAEIARASRNLAERARSGVLTAQEYSEATFTVTNLGMFNVESFSSIINPPQSASLAVGGIRKDAVVRDGQIMVADRMRLTLSIDHRVADGAQGAVFVNEVRNLLENPASLLI